MICARCFKALFGAVLVALSGVSVAAGLTVEDGWVRAVPPVSTTTAGYFTLTNEGDETVTLTGFTTDIAGAGELHTMAAQEDGTRRMQRLPDVPVPAGETVHFAPGGHHLMLFRLARPLEEGEEVELCLTFAEADDLCAPFDVRR